MGTSRNATALHVTAPVVHDASLLLIALVRGDVERGRIARAMADRAEVVPVDTVHEVLALVTTHAQRPRVVLVEPSDRDGRYTAPTVRRLVVHHPDVPVVAYVRPSAAQANAIRDLAVAGAHELLFEGLADSGHALRGVLQSARQGCASAYLLSQVRDAVPALVLPFVELCLRHPERTPQVTAAARVLGVHRKTLASHCRSAGTPPPQELLSWCRVLLATHLLSAGGMTVDATIAQLELPSAGALRNLMRRYAGMSPTAVRERGAYARVVGAFRGAVAGGGGAR